MPRQPTDINHALLKALREAQAIANLTRTKQYISSFENSYMSHPELWVLKNEGDWYLELYPQPLTKAGT